MTNRVMESKFQGQSGSFTNFASGQCHSFGGECLGPVARLRYIDKFDDPQLPDEITVTMAPEPTPCRSEFGSAQEYLSEVIPRTIWYLGWQDAPTQLAALVEPEFAGRHRAAGDNPTMDFAHRAWPLTPPGVGLVRCVRAASGAALGPGAVARP